MERYVIVIPADEEQKARLVRCDDGDTCKLETLQELVGGCIETAESCLAANWAREDVDSMDVLGYGEKRLNRLHEESVANYRQVNEEGHEDLPWAMERLRKCAEDALKGTVVVQDVPDEERMKQSDRDFETMREAFLRRNAAAALGRKAAPAGAAVLSNRELERKLQAVLDTAAEPDSWTRRRK